MANKASVPHANVEQTFGNEPLAAKKTPRLDTRCSLHIHSRRHRLADPDGISCKAAIDGLVLAGVLPDDSAKYVKEVSQSQEKIPTKEIEETLITIMEVDNENA